MVFVPYSFKDRCSNSTQQQTNQPTSQRRSQNVGFSGQSITTTRTPATTSSQLQKGQLITTTRTPASTSSQLQRVVTCAQTPSQNSTIVKKMFLLVLFIQKSWFKIHQWQRVLSLPNHFQQRKTFLQTFNKLLDKNN